MEVVWGGSHRIADPLKRPRALETPSWFAIAGLILVGVSALVWLVTAVELHGGTGGVRDLARLPGLHKTNETWEGINLLCNLLAAVMFLPWFAAAYGNLRRLGVQHLPYSDRWAVGAWLVPFVSMWRPKQIANEIWRGGEAGVDVGSERWRLGTVSPVVHWWWGLYLGGGFVAAIGTGIVSAGYKRFEHDAFFSLPIEGDISQIRAGTVIAILGAALLLAAVVFAVMFVRQATERLEAIRRQLIASEPVGGYGQPAPPPPGQFAPAGHPASFPPPAPQGEFVSCPECAELILPQGTCRYCGYGFADPSPSANR